MQFLKTLIKKLYVLFLMGFVVWYGWFIFPIIFGESAAEAMMPEEVVADADLTEEERMFEKFLKEQGRTATTDLGYQVVKEQYVKGHFHHIGFTVEPDTMNVCIKCHGTVPHDKAKSIRAFLNMHAFYLSCETCHIQESADTGPLAYRWYDKANGELIGNPPQLVSTDKEKYGNYGAKVSPGIMVEGKFRFLNDDKERKFADQYLKKKDLLDTTQQSKMKKVIHRMVNEKPLLCDACHTDREPFLDFAELGYPPRRISDLTSTEVVGMIEKYKRFYIPKFLLPGGDEQASAAKASILNPGE